MSLSPGQSDPRNAHHFCQLGKNKKKEKICHCTVLTNPYQRFFPYDYLFVINTLLSLSYFVRWKWTLNLFNLHHLLLRQPFLVINSDPTLLFFCLGFFACPIYSLVTFLLFYQKLILPLRILGLRVVAVLFV